MKKLFTFAFIFALAAVCPVIADTATTDTTEDELNSLIAQLNEDTAAEPATEQDSTEEASASAEVASDSSAE